MNRTGTIAATVIVLAIVACMIGAVIGSGMAQAVVAQFAKLR